ncbi:MAG: glycosyltransferase [Rhodospirillaceae bacterium]|nr:glycosyltransferase [Rhodospirillaceae bacterium]
MIEALVFAASLSLAAWVYLLVFRGAFWRSDQFLPAAATQAAHPWPDVAAVIPARNEADNIADAVAAHLTQDYPGNYRIYLVNDQSTDATQRLAMEAAAGDPAVQIIKGSPLPDGWTGKLWAVNQGLQAIEDKNEQAKYVLFTDADIRHSANTVTDLVAKAEGENLVLVSQMVMLRCQSIWENFLIPAFVYYFQMLYPFNWVNDPRRKIAAAAGGCMLVRRAELAKAGGIEQIRDRIIDDCALAQLLKPHGPVWLGLTRESLSLRACDHLSDIWSMVTRTAFVQLSHSVLALIGTVAAMIIIYLAPPVSVLLGAVFGAPALLSIGAASWVLMAASYLPTLALYRQPAWGSVFMPIAALLYTLMTIDSARKYLTGKPPAWRNRKIAAPPAREPDR